MAFETPDSKQELLSRESSSAERRSANECLGLDVQAFFFSAVPAEDHEDQHAKLNLKSCCHDGPCLAEAMIVPCLPAWKSKIPMPVKKASLNLAKHKRKKQKKQKTKTKKQKIYIFTYL